MNYSIQDGYTEVEFSGETLYLQLPITPDGIHTDSQGNELLEGVAKKLQDLIESDFEDRTLIRLSYAAGILLSGYTEKEGIFHCHNDSGFEIKLKAGRASNYYNVEYYEVSEDH